MQVEATAVSTSIVASALVDQEQVNAVRSQKQQQQQVQETAASIRVPADRLDRLVDLVGGDADAGGGFLNLLLLLFLAANRFDLLLFDQGRSHDG
jgi:hypothetical protein